MTPAFQSALTLAERYHVRAVRLFGLRRAIGYPDLVCQCSNGGGQCRRPGAHLIARDLNGAMTANLQTLQGWARDYPDINVACATGTQSRLVVIQVDDVGSYNRARKMLGGLPPSLTSRTPSGEVRLWFRAASPVTSARADALGPGLRVFAENAWVSAPGSVEPNGEHIWIIGPDAGGLARLPRAWAEALAPDAAQKPRPRVKVFGLAPQT